MLAVLMKKTGSRLLTPETCFDYHRDDTLVVVFFLKLAKEAQNMQLLHNKTEFREAQQRPF